MIDNEKYLIFVKPLFLILNNKKICYSNNIAEYIGNKKPLIFSGYNFYLEEDNLFTTKIEMDEEFNKMLFENLIKINKKNKEEKEHGLKAVLDLDLNLSYCRVNNHKCCTGFIDEVIERVKAKPICYEHSSDGSNILTIDFKI